MHPRLSTFLSYYRPFKRIFISDLVCATLVAAVAIALPLCIRQITRIVLEPAAIDALGRIQATGALMLALVALYSACDMFVNYRGHMMGTQIEANIRADLFAQYQKLSFGFYDENRTGLLMSRLTSDLENLSELYHHGPEDLVIGALKLVGACVVLGSINLSLTAGIMLTLPCAAIYALVTNRRLNRAVALSRARIGDINAQVEDTLAGIRVVQSFSNEDIEQQKFARANARFIDSRRDVYRKELFFYDALVLFTQLLLVGVALLGGIAILQARMDTPDLLTYLLYIGLIIDPIQRMTNFARLYQSGVAGFNRCMDIMELVPDIADRADAVEIGRARGAITFDNVSFKYRDDHADVMRNISLTIEGGDFVALVGPSGIGKTTLCSLIPRFYDVSDGVIQLDGIDIRGISLQSLRRNIGVVQQDVYLFSGSVAENIGYGKPGASHDDVVAAAIRANAHDFIMALPHGYDTDVGQRGVKLSGGQKQRISIARVFLKDPPILIFDEATSALDNESERAVQASLEQLAHNRTTLVIAHRLSTIRNARKILVLTPLGISEQGRHDELLAQHGVYARLYDAQASA